MSAHITPVWVTGQPPPNYLPRTTPPGQYPSGQNLPRTKTDKTPTSTISKHGIKIFRIILIKIFYTTQHSLRSNIFVEICPGGGLVVLEPRFIYLITGGVQVYLPIDVFSPMINWTTNSPYTFVLYVPYRNASVHP